MSVNSFERTYEHAMSDILSGNKWLVIQVNNQIKLYSVKDFYRHFVFTKYNYYRYLRGCGNKIQGLEYIYKFYIKGFRYNRDKHGIIGELYKYKNKLDKLYQQHPEMLY